MPTTKELLEIRIKETCEEIRNLQCQMNAIVVRSTEDDFAGETENRTLQLRILFAMRNYQDALFAKLNSVRSKYENYCISLRDKLDSMGKTSVERQFLKEFPEAPRGSVLYESKETHLTSTVPTL